MSRKKREIVYTERFLLAMRPEDVTRLRELAEARKISRAKVIRVLVSEAHQNLSKREGQHEVQKS